MPHLLTTDLNRVSQGKLYSPVLCNPSHGRILDLMHAILLLIFLFFSSFGFGQTASTTTVRLSAGNCSGQNYYPWRKDSICFYRAADNRLVRVFHKTDRTNYPVNLELMPTGEYAVSFTNIFQERVTRRLTILEKDTSLILLCLDSLQAYPQNTLSKLLPGDSISINFHSQGCFHSNGAKIVIRKHQDNFTADLYKMDRNLVNKNKVFVTEWIQGDLIKTATLHPQKLQAFTRFENELNLAWNSLCTTTDWYEIKSKYLNVKKTDGGCEWRGFAVLLKAWFGEQLYN